ncbi:MAG: hypothetical protein KF810_04430 [Rhizobiaceae bacterium]|nr:hypothetical protein [Rhizobiaceae bacterium]
MTATDGISATYASDVIKTGANKLLLDRVPACKALETDPMLLFVIAIEQIGGDTTEWLSNRSSEPS